MLDNMTPAQSTIVEIKNSPLTLELKKGGFIIYNSRN